MTVSVVVPVLDDAAAIARLLADLRGTPGLEVIVVDGGSADNSIEAASGAADAVLSAPPGRGVQMRAGADRASGDWLWFLHADSRVGPDVVTALHGCLDRPGWGFCRVRLDDTGWLFRVIETGINWRSATSGIATGDQGIFVHRRLLDTIGGVPPLPLMEDIECCRRLRQLGRPHCVAPALVTSARRWRRHGVARTVLWMWWLRLRYWAGADATDLACRYYS